MTRQCTCGSTDLTLTDQKDGVNSKVRGTPNQPAQRHRFYVCDACGGDYRDNIDLKEDA